MAEARESLGIKADCGSLKGSLGKKLRDALPSFEIYKEQGHRRVVNKPGTQLAEDVGDMWLRGGEEVLPWMKRYFSESRDFAPLGQPGPWAGTAGVLFNTWKATDRAGYAEKQQNPARVHTFTSLAGLQAALPAGVRPAPAGPTLAAQAMGFSHKPKAATQRPPTDRHQPFILPLHGRAGDGVSRHRGEPEDAGDADSRQAKAAGFKNRVLASAKPGSGAVVGERRESREEKEERWRLEARRLAQAEVEKRREQRKLDRLGKGAKKALADRNPNMQQQQRQEHDAHLIEQAAQQRLADRARSDHLQQRKEAKADELAQLMTRLHELQDKAAAGKHAAEHPEPADDADDDDDKGATDDSPSSSEETRDPARDRRRLAREKKRQARRDELERKRQLLDDLRKEIAAVLQEIAERRAELQELLEEAEEGAEAEEETDSDEAEEAEESDESEASSAASVTSADRAVKAKARELERKRQEIEEKKKNLAALEAEVTSS
eukprot:gene8003-12312_t